MAGFIVHITGLLLCIAIAWQDFKSRRVSLWALLALLLAGICYRYLKLGFLPLEEFGTNFLFILFFVLSLIFIFRLRGRKKVMDHLLGWGDALMLIALAAWLSPFTFLCFFTISTSLLAVVFLCLVLSGRITEDYPIPLAGLFALLLPLWILCLYLYDPSL